MSPHPEACVVLPSRHVQRCLPAARHVLPRLALHHRSCAAIPHAPVIRVKAPSHYCCACRSSMLAIGTGKNHTEKIGREKEQRGGQAGREPDSVEAIRKSVFSLLQA
jgi:hypothetical protein